MSHILKVEERDFEAVFTYKDQTTEDNFEQQLLFMVFQSFSYLFAYFVYALSTQKEMRQAIITFLSDFIGVLQVIHEIFGKMVRGALMVRISNLSKTRHQT